MLAFILGSDVPVSPPKVRVSLKIRISMNLVVPAVIIAVATVVVHAGSGMLLCLTFVYLFSLLPRESINVKVKFII